MSWIKRVKIEDWIGIEEIDIDLGKINIISGPKGSGKTSFVEALEKALTNKNRRSEIIRHGEDEAHIFVQLDNGLEVDRKIRTEKSDYCKVSKPGEVVPQTEEFLRKFIKGEIFRPLEFINEKPEKQTEILLNMLDIDWNMDDIEKWFGEIPSSINYSLHILKILKQIESVYYDKREAVNREVKVLEAQAAGIRNELPSGYDGEHWRIQKVQEFYDKVAAANEVNKKLAAAKAAIAGLEGRIENIRANAETDKQTKKNAFDRQRNDCKEFIQLLSQKITALQTTIDGQQKRINDRNNEIDIELERRINDLRAKAQVAKDEFKKAMDEEKENIQHEITKHQNSRTAKETEQLNIDELERQSLQAVDEKTAEQVKTAEAEAGSSKKIVEAEKDFSEETLEKLKKDADNVADMQSYLREYDRMKDILLNKLAPKKQAGEEFTGKIETARNLPTELLKIAAVPIPEMNMDGNGKMRIGNTLIDGLSEGEQLELAFRVALAQSGDLKVIVCDGLNKINEAGRKWLNDRMMKDEWQYFLIFTNDMEFNIKSFEGENNNG